MTTRPSRRTLTIAVAVLALVPVSTALGMSQATLKLSAKMTAFQVVPTKPKGNVAHAAGTFTGTLTSSGSTWRLAWRIRYSGLDNPSIVIADVHYGKPGQFGAFVVRLCGPCNKAGQQQGVTKVKAHWIPAIKLGNTFMTVLTGKNPNGEIRGQIKAT